MTVEELIRHLRNNYQHDDVIAYSLWSVDDILDRARSIRIPISIGQAKEVLMSVNRHKDAAIGISWDTIDAEIDPVVNP